MHIIPLYQHNTLESFSYIIKLENKLCFIVDPFDGDMISRYLQKNNLRPKWIIITHEHHDHFAWVDALLKNYPDTPLFFWEIAGKNIPFTKQEYLVENQVFYQSASQKIIPIFTPWHTFGHMSLEVYENNIVKYLLCGDTLFPAWVGNVRSGDVHLLYETIQNFSKYSDDVVIYSWHNYLQKNLQFTKSILSELAYLDDFSNKTQEKYYFTNFWEERKINLFLQLENETLREKLFGENAKNVTNQEVFIELRHRRDIF